MLEGLIILDKYLLHFTFIVRYPSLMRMTHSCSLIHVRVLVFNSIQTMANTIFLLLSASNIFYCKSTLMNVRVDKYATYSSLLLKFQHINLHSTPNLIYLFWIPVSKDSGNGCLQCLYAIVIMLFKLRQTIWAQLMDTIFLFKSKCKCCNNHRVKY